MIASLLAPWVQKNKNYNLYDLPFEKAHIDYAVKVKLELETESLKIWPKFRRSLKKKFVLFIWKNYI